LFRKPHQISVPASLHGWLSEQFRRLSEQLLGSLEARASFQKRFTGRILTITIVSDFIEENFILDCLHKNSQKLRKPPAIIQKVLFLGPKKIHLVTLSL
jgi:hypothetical protein